MGTFNIIQQKLEQFITKYYTNELIKGGILFFALGLLYFLITLLVEYFLWLNSLGRTFLFWTFVLVEIALFIRFILFPLAKLFKFQNGISYEEASKIIGNHFPEVKDKLLNLIQLNQHSNQNELLAASIEQKTSDLQPISFKNAINFRTNKKYLKYAAIPILIFLLFSVFGGKEIFSSSYKRVVQYDMAFEPPAPFAFIIMNEDLNAIENKSFTLKVRTVGNVIPENSSIQYNGETYYMQQTALGMFEYTFLAPQNPINFKISANKVSSPPYTLEVVNTPSLLNFEMFLDYPSYTGKQDESLKGTGNASIPEGTKVRWQLNTKHTEVVNLRLKDTSFNFIKRKDAYHFEKGVYDAMDYAITTSNSKLKDYENLSYSLNVIKDQFPEISLQSKVDSLDTQRILFLGEVSDDYGLTKLRLVYYPENKEENSQVQALEVGKTNFDQFVYSFPGDLELEDGVAYEYYFEVFDNDAIHNFKSSRSGKYYFRKLTAEELDLQRLENQKNSINMLDKSLDGFKEQKESLEEISRTQKEKNDLNWNDKKKLEDFLKRQKQQEEIMKKFSKDLKKDLENFQPDNKEKDAFKEQLEKRLEENEERLKENEKLLDELEKLQDKINKEELTDKLEKLSKQNKNQEKNLEQLLELTKRFYVEKKAEKLAEDLYKLGEKQEKQADKKEGENTKEAQKDLNKAFQEYKKQMEELQKENNALNKPMDIPSDSSGEKEIDKEQENATDKLEKQEPGEAAKSQKKAGEKMKEMGKKMQQQMKSGGMESLEEDAKVLRQIVDNLVVFSFSQEDLMEDFGKIDYGNPNYGKKLTVQNDLKNNFGHIEDSLFSLSLRQPLIGEMITRNITEVQFNIDKSLDRFAQNQARLGLSNQQYVITGANELAVLLSELLQNMQMQMQMSSSGSGSGEGNPSEGDGEGQGFQLPDIIQKQGELGEKMENGMQEGSGEGEGEGQGEGKGQGKGEGEGEGEGEGQAKSGKDGKGKMSEQNAEGMSGEVFEIFKQQQKLRQELEDRLRKYGLQKSGTDILKRMEGIEQQLLDRGFNKNTQKQMMELKYELLKLENASREQGQETRREATTNQKEFKNNNHLSPEEIKKYFNTNEILNRQALPLRQDYKNKVQEYFKTDHD